MKQRPFGSTGFSVSALGFGTVKLGRNEGVKYPQGFVIPDDKQAAELLTLARDLGINLIDTAPAYGTSEERLGKLLQGQRQHWVICSKTGEEFIDGASQYNFSPQHTRMSVERSLQRLRTDYLDIVLVHSDGNDMDILQNSGVLETLNDLKREGKLRASGVSTKTVAGGLYAAQHSDAVMVTYHPQHTDEVAVLDYCRDHHKACLIKKAFASGHFSGEQIKGEQHRDPVRASLEFVFAHAGATSVIVGTINPQHLRENVAAVNAI